MRIENGNADFDLNTNEKRRNQIIRLKINSIHSKDKAYLIKIIAWCFLAENLKIKLRKGIQQQMKTLDRFIALFYFIGFVTNLTQDLLYFHFEKIRTTTTITIKVKGVPTTTIQIFRFFTTFTTIICLVLIPFHYRIERYLLIMKNEMSLKNTFASVLYYPKIVVIALLTIVHSFPYFDGFYVTIGTTDNIPKYIQVDILMYINIFVSLRWLLAINYFSLYSIFADDRADKICEESKVKRDFYFAMKSQLKYRPLFSLFLLFVASVFLLGNILRNAELPFIQDIPRESFQDWTEILNGFWCILVSFFTIGYGDYYPNTVFGRIIMSVSCLWGIFLVGLLIIYLSSNFLLNNFERKVMDEVLREEGFSKRKTMALEIIYAFYCYNKIDRADNALKEKSHLNKLNQIQYLIHRQKYFRKEDYEHTQSTTSHLLDKFNSKVNIEIDGLINRTRTEIEATKGKIKTSKEIQTKIKRYIKTVSKMTKCLYDCIENKTEGIDQSITNSQPLGDQSNNDIIF